MNKKDFLEKISDIFEIDNTILIESQNFNIQEQIDSIATLSLISFFDAKLNKKVTVGELISIKSVDDLCKLAGVE